MNSPSIVVHRNSGFSRSYSTSSWYWLAYVGFTVWKHWLPVFKETSSSSNQSALDDGAHVVSVPEVVDVLREVIWQQHTVSQCRINESTSRMSLNSFEIQEMFGRGRVHAVLKPFLRSSFRQDSYPGFNWPLRSTIKLCLEFFMPGRQSSQHHHLLDELYHHVVTIWSWILTLQNNLGWIFLDQRLSIFVHEKEYTQEITLKSSLVVV